MSMAFETVKRRVIYRSPRISIYQRGKIYLNASAYSMIRGWDKVLVRYDPETRMMQLLRDVSLPKEHLKYVRKVTKVGNIVSVSAGALLLHYDVTDQRNVPCTDHGPNFVEFGPLAVKIKENDDHDAVSG